MNTVGPSHATRRSAVPTVPMTSGTQTKPAIAAILSSATATPSR